MKKYINFISENINEVKIKELSYFDFINLCDTYKAIDYKDKSNNKIYDIIKSVKDNPNIFSMKSNKYHFLAALKGKEIIGVFYKQLGGNPDIYDDGYIISNGAGQELLLEMRKLGSYTTFSNIGNIPSLKSQLKIGAEIICLTDSSPEKPSGFYNKEISDQSLKQLLIDEKLYYKDGSDKFYFYDESGNLNINGLKDFLINQENITVIEPKKDISSKIKVYFLLKKL